MSGTRQTASVEETARCPAADCCLPVDVVLRSSDKVLIGAHQANLARFSEGFPTPSDVNATDEPVDLTEDGETLQLLMGFMHMQRHPRLEVEVFGFSEYSLFRLAEAAEKYLVYSAMSACNIKIDDPRVLSVDPAKALNYAIKFRYPELADSAALWALSHSSLDAITEAFGLRNDLRVLAWVRFREQYLKLMDTLFVGSTEAVRMKEPKAVCREDHWDVFYKAVVADLPHTPAHFLSTVIKDGMHKNPLYDVFSKHELILASCPRGACKERLRTWRRGFLEAFGRVTPFRTFIP